MEWIATKAFQQFVNIKFAILTKGLSVYFPLCTKISRTETAAPKMCTNPGVLQVNCELNNSSCIHAVFVITSVELYRTGCQW